jgi:hypothetical protein
MKMSQTTCVTLALLLIAASSKAPAQSGYTVMPVTSGGTITGTVKWSGPEPRGLSVPVNKDPEICDPESRKEKSLERLVVGPEGGVANTIVFLKNISRGKAMDLPAPRRSLDQKHCQYEPHILLVPQTAELAMKSSAGHFQRTENVGRDSDRPCWCDCPRELRHLSEIGISL